METIESKGVQALKKKHYSTLSLVGLIYCSVAAGAFGVEEMICTCGPGLAIFGIIGMAIFFAMPNGLAMAELSDLMPEEGGVYFWCKKCFGEFWAFQMGWWNGVGYYVSSSTMIVLAVNYMGNLFDMNNAQALMIKFAFVIIFTIINLLGLKEVTVLSVVFSVVILVFFMVITVLGFANWNYNPVTPIFSPYEGISSSIGLSISVGIWLYCGWAIVTFIAGEVSNKEVIPKSLKIGIPLIAVSYAIPAIAGVAAVGRWDEWSTTGGEGVGFTTVLEMSLGGTAVVLFVIMAVVSQLALFNTTIAGGARAFFVMSDDGLFPRKFITNVSKKKGVPYVGVLTMSLVTVLMMQIEFTALVLIQVIPVIACSVLLSATVVKMRKLVPVEERKSRGYYTVGGGGMLGYLYIVISPALIASVAFFLNGTDYFLYGIFFLLSGVVLYAIIKPVCKGISAQDPEHYPVNPKTKLAFADVFRLGRLMRIIGYTSILGSLLLRKIEGSWGPEYYQEIYGSGLLSDFGGMMTFLLVLGLVCVAIGVLLVLIGKKIDRSECHPVMNNFNDVYPLEEKK